MNQDNQSKRVIYIISLVFLIIFVYLMYSHHSYTVFINRKYVFDLPDNVESCLGKEYFSPSLIKALLNWEKCCNEIYFEDKNGNRIASVFEMPGASNINEHTYEHFRLTLWHHDEFGNHTNSYISEAKNGNFDELNQDNKTKIEENFFDINRELSFEFISKYPKYFCDDLQICNEKKLSHFLKNTCIFLEKYLVWYKEYNMKKNCAFIFSSSLKLSFLNLKLTDNLNHRLKSFEDISRTCLNLLELKRANLLNKAEMTQSLQCLNSLSRLDFPINEYYKEIYNAYNNFLVKLKKEFPLYIRLRYLFVSDDEKKLKRIYSDYVAGIRYEASEVDKWSELMSRFYFTLKSYDFYFHRMLATRAILEANILYALCKPVTSVDPYDGKGIKQRESDNKVIFYCVANPESKDKRLLKNYYCVDSWDILGIDSEDIFKNLFPKK